MEEARRNEEIISLAESQTLRFLDELSGIDSQEAYRRFLELRRELKDIKRSESTGKSRTKRIREIYEQMDEIQFKPEYLCLVCDSEKDYRRACEGFSVNGMEYERLLGTTGGVKMSTIVFVSKQTRTGRPLIEPLRRKIQNGRDESLSYIPAKLEAYMALSCSASSVVSWPTGVAVVKDCETEFLDDYLLLEDDPKGGGPIATSVRGGKVCIDASDGFGLMLPSLSERWSKELGIGYAASGMCIRNSFCKGMVFAFDFLRFADEISGTRMIHDVWGNEVCLDNVELILTESMLKLWNAYKSYDDYEAHCRENGYTYAVTKATPRELESTRSLNYQFLQSYRLTNDEILELAMPTLQDLSGAMGDSAEAAILFLKGTDVTKRTARLEPYDYISALMIDDRMINDPYVRSRIKQMIKKKVTEAKFGKLDVHGNYSIISGDPYALCQSMFGLPVTGILKAGEIYNHYWAEEPADQVVCFRAPMSSHRNIRKVTPCRRDEAYDWYRYMDTVTILNAWDTMCMALNGADK